MATTLPVFATRSSISSLYTRNPSIPTKSALFRAIRLAWCYPTSGPPLLLPFRVFAGGLLVSTAVFTAADRPSPYTCVLEAVCKTSSNEHTGPTARHCYPLPNERTSNPTPIDALLVPWLLLPSGLSSTPPSTRATISNGTRTVPCALHRVSTTCPRFGHAPFFSILLVACLLVFQCFPALLLVRQLIRLNGKYSALVFWFCWLDGSAGTHEWLDTELLDQSQCSGYVAAAVRFKAHKVFVPEFPSSLSVCTRNPDSLLSRELARSIPWKRACQSSLRSSCSHIRVSTDSVSVFRFLAIVLPGCYNPWSSRTLGFEIYLSVTWKTFKQARRVNVRCHGRNTEGNMKNKRKLCSVKIEKGKDRKEFS